MHVRHPLPDKAPELELAAGLVDLDRADFAGPAKDILEKMAMDRLQMREVELASWDAFGNPIGGQFTLVIIQQTGVGETELVP